MLRLSKQVDYAIVLLSHVARRAAPVTPEATGSSVGDADGPAFGGAGDELAVFSARDLADEVGLPLPTVGKVLKGLTHGGLLTSHRGVKGGYSLARSPREITVESIVQALEGPIAVVDCVPEVPRSCDHEAHCSMRTPVQRLNAVVRQTLGRVTLEELNTIQ